MPVSGVIIRPGASSKFRWGTSNPWGVDFNDDGQAFLACCVIPHLFHVVQGGRFQRQAGEHFQPHTYADIQTIARPSAPGPATNGTKPIAPGRTPTAAATRMPAR